MKRLHIVNPYGSIAMERMIYPIVSELTKLYEVTTSAEVDITADLNFHAPWHTLAGLEDKGNGKHVIMYTHCNPPDVPALLDACERADLITCMSYAGRRELVELGADPAKLWVNYCAADQFQYRRRLIGIMGYPQPNGRKREHLLLDLAWQYDLSMFQVLFIGSDFEEITAQLKSLGVAADCIVVDDTGLREIYQRLDCLLVTGYVEGGPLPLLEAMASGTPVLSPRFGYASDLLSDECIYEDTPDLMDKLNEMARPTVFNHQLAKSWTWKDYAAEYALLFGRLLGESVDLYPERGMSRYAQLLDIIDEIKPVDIVEIGTWNGHTASRMIQQAAKYKPIDMLDYDGYDLFELQTGEQFRRELSKHGWPEAVVRKRLEATDANIHLVPGDTKWTLGIIYSGKPGAEGLFFVDGGHSEETIENDAGFVLDALGENAVAIFDDYYHAGKPEGVGCNAIIDELDTTKFEVTHLPARTVASDGREIGMVKVRRRNANIRVPMQTTASTGTFSNIHTSGFVQDYTVPGVRFNYAPSPSDGDGELERLTAALS